MTEVSRSSFVSGSSSGTTERPEGGAAMGWEHGDSHWFLQALLLAQKGEGGVCFFMFRTFMFICVTHSFHRTNALKESFNWKKGKVLFDSSAHVRPASDSCASCGRPPRIVGFPDYRLVFWCNFLYSSRAVLHPELLWHYENTRILLSDGRVDPSADGCLTKRRLTLQDLIRGRFHQWLRNLTAFLINTQSRLELNPASWRVIISFCCCAWFDCFKLTFTLLKRPLASVVMAHRCRESRAITFSRLCVSLLLNRIQK